MVKFPGKKKKKGGDEATPLMIDEQPKPSASSSSGLGKDDKAREARKKEREARRGQRDKRLADNKESKKSAKAGSKKKSKPKLTQEEQDAKDANLGCCHHFAKFIVKSVHLLDALIGLVFVIYGAMIYEGFDEPAMEAVYATLTYGCVLIFTSAMGVIGFTTKLCWRCGLLFSAYTAPFIGFFYIFVIIALLASPDVYFDYLTEHKDVLYLNDAEIATLRSLIPLFCIILASLAAVEITRFFVLVKIRDTLIRFDGASRRIAASERSKASERSQPGSNRTGWSSDLSEPLLDGDESV